jgi:hypothetical protein
MEKIKKDKLEENDDSAQEAEEKPEKIEICYICNKKFDINVDDESYYWQNKYPFCAYCAEFYGFYR